jgi:hypothetical protein
MTTTRPGLWPLHDLLGINVTEPENSLFMQSGYPTGLPVPSADHNGKFGRAGLWHQYVDLNGVRNYDWLDTSTTGTLSSTTLRYNVGGNVLTTGATVLARGVHLIAGTRIETDTAFLNQVGARQGEPLIYTGATVPGRIWIYANADGTSRMESVGPAIADVPNVGEVTLVGLQVDALGVVTDGAVAPAVPLPAQLLGIAIDLLISGNVGISGDIGVSGDADITGNTHIVGTLLVEAAATFSDNVEIGGDLDMTGGAISDVSTLVASSSAATITATSSNATNAAVNAINTSTGIGLQATSIGALATVLATNTGTGPAVRGVGGSAAAGVQGVATVAGQPGVLGTGFNGAGSHGVEGVAVNTSSHGVSGSTAAAATSSAAAVRADARGNGVGISASGVDGNAAYFESNVFSPTRAATVWVGQDTDPSTTQVGSLFFQTTRVAWRTYNGTEYRSFHYSPKGWLFGLSAASTSSNATTSGDIGDITIAPEQAGVVVVSVTGVWKGSTDTTQLTVLLKDITGAVTILTTQVLVAPDRDADGQDRTVPFTVRYFYTLPSAASRLFRYRLNVSATTNWYDVFMTVQGVY